ncbi:MAG: hypothetical protein JSS81_07520 [Acidobacteria bacterium]|nr:hypothetical protein [Acidobacteriota bacterium]
MIHRRDERVDRVVRQPVGVIFQNTVVIFRRKVRRTAFAAETRQMIHHGIDGIGAVFLIEIETETTAERVEQGRIAAKHRAAQMERRLTVFALRPERFDSVLGKIRLVARAAQRGALRVVCRFCGRFGSLPAFRIEFVELVRKARFFDSRRARLFRGFDGHERVCLLLLRRRRGFFCP